MRRSLSMMLLLLEKAEQGTLSAYIQAPLPKQKELENFIERKRQTLIDHVLLLKEAGYLSQLSISFTDHGLEYHGDFVRLTMKGHDLLALMRSNPLRQRMEEILKSTGLPLISDSLDLIQHEAIDELIRERTREHKAKLGL